MENSPQQNIETVNRPLKPNPKYNIFQLAKIARRIPRAIARANHKLKNVRKPNSKKQDLSPGEVQFWMGVRRFKESQMRNLNVELLLRNTMSASFRDARPHKIQRAERLARAKAVISQGIEVGALPSPA